MKKVLTILVVLALVAGFAFAEVAPKTQETHTLTITASVDVEVPVFQLFRDNTLKTNTDANKYDNVRDAYEATDVAGFKLDAGGSVIVSARVANMAKQKQNYSLQFTDGEFKNVKRNGGNGTQTPAITVAKNNTTTDGVTLSQVEDSDTVTAAFTGTKMTVSGYTLATATYTYDADSTIDPGTYSADIVLTVKAL